ncbi:hypothetical protein BpHYR1_019387 [Brachionus plicatilis]|uniref:Uncharacterized protein n=1 Tax=Brachionus plicatilis TaxID=10195 RepID=A0A3M7SJ81_BRAPC|nr:hypothetical protein BpHYR1_019387 [Brachionus plicatilis]
MENLNFWHFGIASGTSGLTGILNTTNARTRPLLAIAICFALLQQIALILTVSKLDWLRQLL